MKTRYLTAAAGLVLLIGNTLSALTIMPFGDSITVGFAEPVETRGAYRLELEKLFIASTVPFDYVGDFHGGTDGMIDGDYQALGGYQIQQMTADFASAVFRHRPDIVLVLAGTNNHWDPVDYGQYFQKYTNLVEMIHTNSPDSRIVFSTVPKFGCCREDFWWTPEWVAERNDVKFPLMNKRLVTCHSHLSASWTCIRYWILCLI